MADQVASYAIKGDATGATAAFKDVGAAIERTEKKAQTFEQRLGKMTDTYDRLARNAEKVSREQIAMADGFSKLSGTAQVAIGNMIAMGGQRVLSGLKSMIAGTYESVNRFQDLSGALGESTDSIQIYSAWAQQSGTSVDTMSGAIAKLQTNIAKGDKDLKQFGITALDGKDAFMQVVAAMEKAPTQIEKVRIAEAAFGNQWKDIMPVLKQGADNLGDIAANTALIDPETIKKITEMNGELEGLKTDAKAAAAELMGLFGPAMQYMIRLSAEGISYWREKFTPKESDDEFAKRVGITRWGLGGKNVRFKDEFNPTEMSSGDLQRALDMRNEAQKKGGVVREGNWEKSLEIYQRDAYVRENEARDAAAKKAADDAAETQRLLNIQNGLNPDGTKKVSAKERDLTPDYVQLSLDARAEEGMAWLKKNPGTELDPAFTNPDYLDSLRNNYAGSNFKGNDRASAIRKMQNLGLVNENGVGVIDSTDMSLDEINTQIKETEEALKGLEERTISVADTINDAFADIAGGGIRSLDKDIAHLTVQGELSARAIGDAFRKNVLGVFEQALATLMDIGWEMSLKAIFAGTGAEGFVSKMFAHATGTLSSPGGVGTLSERGIERVITPQGGQYLATPGLYAMSEGARVIPAQSAPTAQSISITIHQNGGDPAQNAEEIRRIVREESSRMSASLARTRNVY